MTLEVRLRQEAEEDLADAAALYEGQRQGLGREFLDEILTMISSIADILLRYPNIHRNIRRPLIQRFPFGIYYRVEDTTIVIIAVIHGSRNPRRRKKRP